MVASRSLTAARVVAVLGPTNTGKTHLAVERMLGHRTGVIGLPLRLLAREIYDRVCGLKGRTRVALLTGEEKIVPANPAYFVCTVESMPLERSFDFLAVDEIQLAADPERGHVFTDRLLHARGDQETMLLGADTIKRLVRRLVPEAEHIARPRFSTLSFAGARKISRLPRRSVVVSFSAAGVYALAELVRRQRGGTAVVLGALSPRTRNAQVAMYQAGEVDYLVATDAIGMGLNMDVDHVAFASLRKFDGRARRALGAAELGQIAGRAGRHMSDGTFGTTPEAGTLSEELVERVENHRFETLKALSWRNTDLDFRSLAQLNRSLEAPSGVEGLVRAREAVDQVTLGALAKEPEIAALAVGPAAVRLLWEVCQVPDFRKTMAEAHVRLVGQIYRYLRAPEGVLPADWVARHMATLERTDGDIDTLATRIAHVRTWTYVSHRPGWIADARHWQERARAIEDRLSDALHASLTQRFVDRRAAVLVRRLRENDELRALVDPDGGVTVEGEFVGELKGLAFHPDPHTSGQDGRALRAAVRRALTPEIGARAEGLAGGPDRELRLDREGMVWWRSSRLARLWPGDHVLKPRLELVPNEILEGAVRERLRHHLEGWLERRVNEVLAPLMKLRAAALNGAARGLAFQLVEGLGAVPRRGVAEQVRALGPSERRRLNRLGVRFGTIDLYLPALLNRPAAALRAILWAVHAGALPVPPMPRRASAAAVSEVPPELYRAAGYAVYGGRAVRLDAVEKLASAARRLAAAGPFQATRELGAIIGGGAGDLAAALADLGYRAEQEDEGGAAVFSRGPPRGRGKGAHKKGPRRPARQARVDPHSPFAKLKELKVPAR